VTVTPARPLAGRPVVRLVAWTAALLLGLAPALAGAPASAHAQLRSTVPAAGDVVETMPPDVELTFNEAVASPAYVVVTAPDGGQVDAGEPEVVDGTVTQPVRDEGGPGQYTVDYRIVSADGHPISGSYRFNVQSGPSAAPPTEAGFWSGHWEHVVLAGVGLLVGVALLGVGLRGRE
jgi:methionine-rich copper-binding protein CopC